MAKRKAKRDPQKDEELPDAPPAKDEKQKNEEDESDEDEDMVNVDFEWFDPQPAVDFHGLKNLLKQLLDVDAHLFDLSALADLILSQPLLGSTVKVDGNEGDPFAFLTVLNLETHKDKQVIKDLKAYLSKHSTANRPISLLSPLLSEESPTTQVGLILTERFINMPHEIVPPMYSMLMEEIEWALEEKEPYNFTHYLILSKTYTEIESQIPNDEEPRSKKKKGADKEESFYFHPEDEVLHKHAAGWGSFEYETPVDEGASDSKRTFQELGVKPKGHMILIEAEKFPAAVEAVRTFLNGGFDESGTVIISDNQWIRGYDKADMERTEEHKADMPCLGGMTMKLRKLEALKLGARKAS